jgi:hypothetical protein
MNTDSGRNTSTFVAISYAWLAEDDRYRPVGPKENIDSLVEGISMHETVASKAGELILSINWRHR